MTNTILAGAKAGIPITGSSVAEKQFLALKNASVQKGNYWAQTAVRTVESLCSGHMKDCVYVSEVNHGPRQLFTIMMPGCTAKVMKRSNGEYRLLHFQANGDYVGAQRQEDKPGYFELKSDNAESAPSFVASGLVSKERYPVCITDQYSSVDSAATNCTPYVKRTPNINTVMGFGLHYTPGKNSIGGWRNITQACNADRDKSLSESAMVLARTMREARSLGGITWVSERGGIGVLTQAMKRLKQENISFKGKKHQVFFAAPTTNVATAQQLALDIGFEFERHNKNYDFLNPAQLIGSGRVWGGNIYASLQRSKYDTNHTTLKVASDVLSEVAGGHGTIDKIKAVGAGVAIIGGGAATATTGGAAVIGVAVALTGLTPALFQSFFPNHYNKLSDKL
jgi:hypothetical protein